MSFYPINSEKQKLNLTLVLENKRIYGEDAEGGIKHIHPFKNPEIHKHTITPPSLENFLTKVQKILRGKETYIRKIMFW